jgi:tetratricopeptide (TPR) repeat protein
MLGYSFAELGNASDKDAYNKGLGYITNFFDKTSSIPNFKYVATDYKYKGILLAKTGKDSLGIIELEKAASIDPTKANEILREIARAYVKSKKYPKAIETYEKLLVSNPANLNGTDYFDLGRAYYFGPKDFVKADTSFARLTRLNPTFATAFFWRAKANTQQDLKNEKWMAKPYYEAGISLVKTEERSSTSYKTNVIEASEYLGYYYLTIKDNAKAKEYFTIIKDLDATNKKQIEFFKSPAGK